MKIQVLANKLLQNAGSPFRFRSFVLGGNKLDGPPHRDHPPCSSPVRPARAGHAPRHRPQPTYPHSPSGTFLAPEPVLHNSSSQLSKKNLTVQVSPTNCKNWEVIRRPLRTPLFAAAWQGLHRSPPNGKAVSPWSEEL